MVTGKHLRLPIFLVLAFFAYSYVCSGYCQITAAISPSHDDEMADCCAKASPDQPTDEGNCQTKHIVFYNITGQFFVDHQVIIHPDINIQLEVSEIVPLPQADISRLVEITNTGPPFSGAFTRIKVSSFQI
ncbi:MAG TPA: hypothetical protein PK511_02805 [Chitinophagales bacterium]|nr:hypothetical protein [Chitinophagales bacterium]HMX03353.1 hypothetical protein [Chitinophagales bacterium]HMZ89117.1 hypothetical protein [Chitinophagales bacterium]HNA56713.1 hypothetical protein [Chitinophagales bacterium]HNE44540.1 hypothetical protein [Chitinophagales bacterium]